MKLIDFPRVLLAHLPTPLEHMPRLSKHLGGPDIYVKRDDCTGLATGGNKTRKLEFSMGEALQQGADTIITVGAVQSNHVRQTAAAACKLGMKCEVLLEHRVADPSDTYANSGNVFLDRIFGANLREYAGGSDFDAAIAEVEEEIRVAGGTPYIIPGGASNPVGALGYVNCGIELLQQLRDQNLSIDHVVTATGSAGTHAGLAVGLRGSGSDIPIWELASMHRKTYRKSASTNSPAKQQTWWVRRAASPERTSSPIATISGPVTVSRLSR